MPKSRSSQKNSLQAITGCLPELLASHANLSISKGHRKDLGVVESFSFHPIAERYFPYHWKPKPYDWDDIVTRNGQATCWHGPLSDPPFFLPTLISASPSRLKLGGWMSPGLVDYSSQLRD